MRKNIVAGNWKMNNSLEEGDGLVNNLLSQDLSSNVEVILIPSFIHLQNLNEKLQGSKLKIGSQNNHAESSGAYTGEVSVKMLKSVGVEYGLVGHSERRMYFKESNADLLAKTKALLSNGINVIFCCGEVLEDRKSGKYFETVSDQLQPLLSLDSEEFKNVTVAYEPVWAIGTGETASVDQAQEMHHFIRNLLKENYSQNTADSTSILYGGSCNPKNAKELFSMKDVDGGLIGGASLKADDFASIINSF